MEYQKIINLLKNTINKSTKFRTKNSVDWNDESRGTYNAISQIRFKTTMLRSSLCDYSDTYILVKRTITTTGTGANAAERNEDAKDIQKLCTIF